MKKLMIVEDDRALSQGIVMALNREGYRFVQCGTLAQARQELARGTPDLMLLDINLPDGNGFAFLRELQETRPIPVIVVTANDMELDEVMGLELGAADYITKPFSLMVLRARIEKALRQQERGDGAAAYEQGSLLFDFAGMHYYIGGREILLSATEQRLLRLLVENRNSHLTRAFLIDRIWTDGAEYVDENALSVTVKRLRDKIEENPSKPQHIQTVYGIGYVWR
ncbi:MAG: response regulator transcription factor [Roseburia sp.]|nr:response regulator transcription factor [Roseburia sp.]